MATHFRILALSILPWTEEPGKLQSKESESDTTQRLILSLSMGKGKVSLTEEWKEYKKKKSPFTITVTINLSKIHHWMLKPWVNVCLGLGYLYSLRVYYPTADILITK